MTVGRLKRGAVYHINAHVSPPPPFFLASPGNDLSGWGTDTRGTQPPLVVSWVCLCSSLSLLLLVLQESSNLLPFTPSPLRNEDYMGDVFIRKARQRRDFKFVYKRKIFLHSHAWPSQDPAFNRLVYLQVRDGMGWDMGWGGMG